MAMRRVIDSNPQPVGSSGVASPTDALTLRLSRGVCNSLAGWASPLSPCTLYALERPAPSSLFQKIISVLSRKPIDLGVQAFAFERTKCS
jgi:hypothetical protein